MKNLSTLLMVIVILFGLILAATPFIGSIFFPLPENSTQQPKTEMVRSALAQWFNAPSSAFVDVQAIRKMVNEKQVSRYSFSTPADVVRSFIIVKNLQQEPLSSEIMETIFTDKTISWWQPEALKRETWFSGTDQGRTLSLIYNAETKRGVLVIE
ncbi:MAG: hypothetical protein V3U78_03345 [Thiotrichaceae bacterium]